MPLTPADVRNKQFSTTRLRPGYDEEEVDAFLDEVEAELDRLDSGERGTPVEAGRGPARRGQARHGAELTAVRPPVGHDDARAAHLWSSRCGVPSP